MKRRLQCIERPEQPPGRTTIFARTARPILLRALRILAAVVLLSALAYGVEWNAMPRYFAELSWPMTLLAGVGLTAQFAVSPWKWRSALEIHDLHFRLPYLIRANGVGFFFNNFLPSGIGGDAYRVMSTWPQDGYRSRAVSAVLIERVVGFAALIAIGNLGALTLIAHSRIARVFVLLSLAGAFVGVCVLLAIYVGWLKFITNRIRHTAFFEALSHNVGYLRRGGRSWASLIAVSVLFQTIAVGNIYILFHALGAPASFASCAMIGAAAGLATIIPLSINGLGVVEGSLAGVAVALGLDYEAGLTVAVLIRLLVLPASLVFGVLYALGGDTPARAKREAGAQR